MSLKELLFKNKYRTAHTLGALVIFAPFILILIFSIPLQLFPEVCSSIGCSIRIFDAFASVSFGLAFMWPWFLAAGVLISLFTSSVYAIKSVSAATANKQRFKNWKIIFSLLAGSFLFFLVYIPAGPNECSRSLTIQQYEKCIENIFVDMSPEETELWLRKAGYREVRLVNTNSLDYYRKCYDWEKSCVAIYAQTSGYGLYGINFTRAFMGLTSPLGSTHKVSIEYSRLDGSIIRFGAVNVLDI